MHIEARISNLDTIPQVTTPFTRLREAAVVFLPIVQLLTGAAQDANGMRLDSPHSYARNAL